jgi:tetratricopeptide (TPR) repeat protein
MIERRSGPAEELLKQAIAKDPEFASAHIFLAWAIRDQDKPADAYMKHAEQAVQLAGTTSDRERYYIQGSYSEMKGESEKAIHAYEALLSLYPDHFWANNNLAIELTREGEEQRALTYVLRRADLRPNSFRFTRQAAIQLLRGGDRARAKTYVTRAVDLMTPEDVDSRLNNIALIWVPAFEALIHADPETALREANRSLERLRSFEGRRFVNDSPMGALYLTLGKIEQAREWFEETTEPSSRRQIFFAAIAYVEEDHKAMTEHLEQALKARESRRRIRGERNTRRGPVGIRPALAWQTFQLLLTRGGLLSEADLNARTDPGRPDFPGEWIKKRNDILRGVLAVSRDNRIEGLRMLGDALLSISLTDNNSAATYFVGSEILAEGWRERGDWTNAAEVLRAAVEQEAFLLLDQSVLTGPLWLKLQAQLAQLYREMGQDEDARKIEDKLRRLLALADPDHPILRQLDHTQDLALREGLSERAVQLFHSFPEMPR